MGLLEDRVVLVNGGSQGVGAGVVRTAVGEGATIVFTGRRAEVGEKLTFDQHMAINLKAPFFAMQAAVADMTSRSAPGTIVNIGSNCAHGGPPYLAPYSTAKAGLAGLTRNAAHAHRFDRIRINTVNIGWTDTEGEDATQRAFHGAGDDWREQAAARQPMGKLGQPDEIADFVVFLLSDRSGVVTGSVIDWDQNVLGALD